MDYILEENITDFIVFGGGCFWCTEHIFKMLKGVVSVKSGYAGGHLEGPTYEEVATGITGHAEVIKVEYNPNIISLNDLLAVFFSAHDPTSKNQQGPDTGEQYRSIILYTTKEQGEICKNYISQLNASNLYGKYIVTEVKPFDTFFEAGALHHDYYKKNPDEPYSRNVISPKVKKIKEEFRRLLK